MSKFHNEPIQCPKCGEHGTFQLWETVNADLNPELREKIFNEELFLWECPKCGAKVFIPYGTIYHDMSHKFMLFYQHEEMDDKKYKPLLFPNEMGLDEDYTLRMVCGLQKLREKIRILENGLNDIAIERMKYMIIRLFNPEIAERGYYLFFMGVNNNSTKEHEYGTIFFGYYDENHQTKARDYSMDMYYEECLACEVDLRMKVTGCQCVDDGWIAKQLKKAQ